MTQVPLFKIESGRRVDNFHDGTVDPLEDLLLLGIQDVRLVEGGNGKATELHQAFLEPVLEIGNGLHRLALVRLEVLVVKMI